MALKIKSHSRKCRQPNSCNKTWSWKQYYQWNLSQNNLSLLDLLHPSSNS